MGYLNNKLEKVATALNAQPESDGEVDTAKLIGGGAATLAGTGALAASPFATGMAFDQVNKPINELDNLKAKLRLADLTGGRDVAMEKKMLKELSPEARNILAIGARHARRGGRASGPFLTSFKAQRLPGKLKILAPVLALGGGAAATTYGANLMNESRKGRDLSNNGGKVLKTQ